MSIDPWSIGNSAFMKTLRNDPFKENVFELFVENAIDQGIDACRKVNQDSINIHGIFHLYTKETNDNDLRVGSCTND